MAGVETVRDAIDQAVAATKERGYWQKSPGEDILSALLAAPESVRLDLARRLNPWRPIETAPKMKAVLLWAATDVAESGEIKNWKMDTGYRSTGAETWVWEGRQLRKYDVQPSHYLPLPAPPASEDET